MKHPSKVRKVTVNPLIEGFGDAKESLPANKIRLLVADDHPTVLAGLVAIIDLMPDMRVVAEASNGFEAVELWHKHQPDVTLLDLRMPKMDDPLARIIILTTYDTDNEIYRAVKAGAKGFLLKDARREELLECIRKVYRNELCIPQTLMEKLATAMSGQPLTAREIAVLSLLALGKSNKEIGAKLIISETTVKGHLQHIYTKLHVLSRTEAIAEASRRGLISF